MRSVLEIVLVLFLPCISWAAGDSLLADTLEGIPVYEMTGMTVTATRVPSRLSDVPIGTEVIDAEEIDQIGAADAAELLRTGVGVDIKSYGYAGSVSSISIRGSTASQVLVLLDGRPTNSISLGTADLSEATLSDVDRVEVVRGPSSSLYGANALGGVVNVITRPTRDKPSISGMAEFGSYKKQIYSASASSFMGGVGLDLSTYWRDSDGDRENSDYKGRKVSGKLGYSGIEWLKGSLAGAFEWFDLGSPGPVPPEDSIPKYGSEEVTSLFDRQKNRKGYADLSLEMKLGERNKGRAKFYYDRRDMDFHAVYRGWDNETFSYFKAVEDDEYITTVAGADLQIDAYSAPKLRLIIGLDASVSTFDATSVVVNDSTKEETETCWAPSDTLVGFYVESELRPTESISLIGSARHDWSRAYGRRVSPNFGAIFRFGPRLRTKFSVGHAFRAPTLNDLYWPEQEFMGGNPDVRPEIGVGTELRVEWEPLELLDVAASFFQRNVEDLIAWGLAQDAKWRPTNVNEYSSNGVELEFELGPIMNAKLRGHFTYLSALERMPKAVYRYDSQEVELTERRAAFIPETRGWISASYKAPFGFDFLLDASHSGNKVGYFLSSYGFPPPLEEKWLNEVYVLNGRVGFAVGPQYFFIKIENVFDARYGEEFGNKLTDRDYPRPARTFSYGMKLKIK